VASTTTVAPEVASGAETARAAEAGVAKEPMVVNVSSAPLRVKFAETARVIKPAVAKEPTVVNVSSAPPARLRVKSAAGTARVAQPARTKEATIQNVSTTLPVPVVIKTIGYAEKAGGQLEAIILQEDEVQVVHIGDRIEGRYRVTKVSPDSVEIIEETLVQSPIAKPDVAISELAPTQGGTPTPVKVFAPWSGLVLLASGTGYPQEESDANGSSLGDLARQLRAQRAQDRKPVWVITNDNIASYIELASRFGASSKKMGHADSAGVGANTFQQPWNPPVGPASVQREVLAAAGKGDQLAKIQGVEAVSAAVVPQARPVATFGPSRQDRSVLPQFAHLGTAFLGFVQMADGKVETVVADGDSVRLVPEAPAGILAQANTGSNLQASVRGTGILPVRGHGQDGHGTRMAMAHRQNGHNTLSQGVQATFVFQTLGYVEMIDGEMQAVVADGPELYLVKQGKKFAGQYFATSVDPTLVLAVKVSPNHEPGDALSAQTESGSKPASNMLLGYLQHPSLEWPNAQAFHEIGASGSPAVLTDWGVNLLNSSLTGFDLQSHFLNGR
jgi:hypothetical protein